MTQRINDKLKKCCELCQSHLDKPCAWLSLGNEYCDTIMEVQSDIEIKDKVIDELINFLLNYDIDEDYCKKIERQECNKYKEGYCDKCIKQHFYKKASEWYTKERWKEICYKQVEKVGGEDE